MSVSTSAEDREHGHKDNWEESHGQRQKKVDLCLVVILLGYGACTLITYVNEYLGLYYPYDTFLFRPNDRFGDFINQYKIAGEPYAGPSPQQMPLAYAILKGLRLLPRRTALLGLLGLFLLSAGALAAYWTRGATKSATVRNALIFLLCSYPILITVDRANMEALIFMALGVALLLFFHERWWAGAVMLAVAVAIKPFAAVFLLLPLVRRRYLEALVSLGLGVTLMLGPLLFFSGGPSRNFQNLRNDMAAYHKEYELGRDGLFFNHSLFGLVKSHFVVCAEDPLHYLKSSALEQQARRALPYYRVAALAMLGLVVWRLFCAPLALWKQAALLTCCMNLLPLTSGDYRLLHFLSVFGLFAAHTESQDKAREEAQCKPRTGNLTLLTTTYALLLGFLLAPRNIYHLQGLEITSATVLTPLAMVVLSALILLETRRPSHAKAAISKPVDAVA